MLLFEQAEKIQSQLGHKLCNSLLIFTLVFLVIAECLRNRRPRNFPPGPLALPLVGNMFSLDLRNAHRAMTELAETYGKVYSLKLGSTWTVVLNGLSTMQEALLNKGDILNDRPVIPLHVDKDRNQGIIFTNGHLWKEQRRFALFTLKYFGVGKRSLESSILNEFIYLSKEFANEKGKPFNPHYIINKAVSNIICSLVFGQRFDYCDEKFLKMTHLVDKVAQIEGSIWTQVSQMKSKMFTVVVIDFVTHISKYLKIEMHSSNLDPSEPRDFIDCYLNEIQKDGVVDSVFHEENLVTCVFDLFVAGTETTSTTLRWALLYMAKYTEIQEKVQAEIDRVIGQSRQPSMEDRPKLPYTDAVIHELQRISNIVPLSLPHVTKREVQLEGYKIPKGVTVIPNLTSVLFDKSTWETPYTFNPGHFLNKEGKFVKQAAFIPFSLGKRACLGENLARMELFLFFTSFMQRFTFSMPPGMEPVFKPQASITLKPSEYEICITQREVCQSRI
uniref:Cytochrome P450 2J6-like n=1 Tax=Echeneis naucrates TaxID=173247 RepID=A0A665UCJ1_ECHNA